MEYAAQLPVVAAALKGSNVDCSMLRKLDDDGLRELGVRNTIEREAALRRIGIALLGIGELPPPPMVVGGGDSQQFGCFADTSPGQVVVRFGAPSQSSYGRTADNLVVPKGSPAAHQLRIRAFTITRHAPDSTAATANHVREIEVYGDQQVFEFTEQVTPSWRYQYTARAWSTAGGSLPVPINESHGCTAVALASFVPEVQAASKVWTVGLSFKQLNTDGDGCCECATDRHLPAACLPLRLPRCRCRGAGRSGELCAVLEQHRF